ncbi:hypothetical protein HJC23_006276 [Cyclotella cryptica]|uniref:Uncharacterized protein n=1 Tax=Cyclotella cryptica TaxID=29204 RepID=A0ABD3NTA8_9STRA|eukprot:CCRYP_020026-RA/>CCRYP_020026-RA protein AED:0.16 eAED:0.16 QI:0/-1/0/1/-1/1/1/0/712
MASSSHDPIDSPPRAGTSTDEIPARGDPFADLIPWSSPPTTRTNHQSRLRTPPTLERTSSNEANLRHRSNTASSVQHIPPLSDTVDARKRCNTADHVADGRLVAASHVACRPILQPNSPQSLILPNKYTELNDNNYINNKNKHMLSPLECNEINGHRGRTSTLESVMAVKSLSSTAHSVANSENDKRLANHSHKRRAAASKDNYFFDNALQSWQGIASNNGHEIQDRPIMSMSSNSDDVLFQDDPSEVSSLSDDDDDADHGDNDDDHQRDAMEKDDKKKKSCTLSRTTSPACVPTGGVRAMAALFKKPLVKNITSGSKPVAIRLRQGSDTAKDTVTTATTSAMHTLETMDNFDVPSAFSPLGALSGEEELSFFKSGSKSSVVGGGNSSVASGDQFQSLHGYHRRCKHGVPAYRSAKQNVGIQNSWLVSSPGGPHVQWRERDVDLIDMSDDLNHDSVSPPPTTVTSIPNVVVGGACEASVVSGASSHVFTFKSGDVSLPDIGTMSISTGGEQSQRSLPTQGRLISRPPIVGRSKTSPAFLNDDPVLFSRSRYRNPMPQSSFQSGSANMRKRPSQIATGVINSPCMISSIALSEATSPKAIAFPRRPSFSRNSWNFDCGASQVTFGSLHTKGEVTTPSLPSLEEQEDDENASFGSFAEELRRKDKRKMIAREVKHFMKHAIIDPKPVVRKGMKWLGMEVKPADKSLKRADGCLT